ncbi:abc transporter i family member 17 [Quercus suber]|uniref:Abc transporter i family member 17 n=1 Tax=Quercus suber TaxID=58331 RepID=A0AAW0JQH6_QUESU
MLRALNRLWEPPLGTVFLDGTVADNIRYGPQLRGQKLSDEEVYSLLKLADLDSSFYSNTGGELSVGQAQRVALARTLANKPEVLLLDEPTSALDPISTENIEDVLVNLKKKQGMTIIMVSHSIKQIQRIADIVCLLVKGEIVEELRPDKLSEAKHPMALRFLQLSS